VKGNEKPSSWRLGFYAAFIAFNCFFLDFGTSKGRIGAALLVVMGLLVSAVWIRDYRKWQRDPAPPPLDEAPPRV
jgi:hypothetical protein